jgi:hypothetical protein
MLILEQDKDGMVLVRLSPAKPSVIAGGLFGALATVPILSGTTLSGPRLVTTLALSTVAAALVWLGRPMRRKLPLPVELQKGRHTATTRIELGGSDSYQARLARGDGSSTLLFERNEPAGVIRDVLSLTARHSVSVRPAWGLTDVAWAVVAQLPSAGRERPLESPVVAECWPLQRQRTAAYTTLWAGLFVLVVAFIMAVSPYRSGITPSALSVLLPALTALYVLVVGLWLLGLRERLTLQSSGVERATFWFGRPLGQVKATPARVHAAFTVAPKSVSIRHVVVATGNGPLAFAVDPEVAEKLSVRDHEIGPAAGRAAE